MDYNTIQTIGGIALLSMFILPILTGLISRNWEFALPVIIAVLVIPLFILLSCSAASDSIRKKAEDNLRWKEQAVEIVEIGGAPRGYEVKTFSYQGYTVKYVKLTDNIVAVVNEPE